MVKTKTTNNDIQIVTQNTKDWAARTLLKTAEDERMSSGMINSKSSLKIPEGNRNP
jgi:hypothetical protein